MSQQILTAKASLGIDRHRRIEDQRFWQLPNEVLDLFPRLKLDESEIRWCHFSLKELTEKELGRNEYGVKKFRRKLECRNVVRGLISGESQTVKAGIERLSTNLNGGDLDRYVFWDIYKFRGNAEIQRLIRPAITSLIETACEHLNNYVKSGQPEVLDKHFRNFHVLAITVVRIDPGLGVPLAQEFSKILGSFKTELAPDLLLVSLPALGYGGSEISEWDERYIQPWRFDAGRLEGWVRGIHVAAYNAPPKLGWALLQMHPYRAHAFIRKYKESIVTSLIGEMYRKCTKDPLVNPAWLAARFFKLHQALHAINGKNAYAQLSEDLSRKTREISRSANRAVRRCEDFEGKIELQKISGSVEAFLKSRF